MSSWGGVSVGVGCPGNKFPFKPGDVRVGSKAVIPVSAGAAWVSVYRRHSHEPKRAPNAAPPPPDYGGAAGAARARAAGSSLAPRKQGSAHWDNRLGRYSGHSERSAGTDRAR